MPDLNSVPASPHPQLSSSRRPSNSVQMASASSAGVAAVGQSGSSSSPGNITPSSSLNILPSNQTAVNNQQQHGSAAVSSLPSPHLPSAQPAQPSELASGPGPLRHPRPMTTSELHTELEKEQEALVNRLTRELSLLRATHNASVASNASSVSATNSHDPITETSLLSGSGFSIPTTRRHHRTSSTASQSHQLVSSFDGRGTHFPRPPAPVPLSRQDSSTSRSSQAAPGGGVHLTGPGLDPSSYFHQQRVPHHASSNSVAATPGSSFGGDHTSPAFMPATSRYEETAFYRGELETAKKENDMLKKRVRELEKLVRERRESSTSRHVRSESVSTTASTNVVPTGGASIAGPRDKGRSSARQSVMSVAVGVPDDEVKVGESAASYASRAEGE
ncbi:hypothetical protein ISF_02581 [Cordyceps fumosorosea ARSEF 2679]|uniref:Uncharacterized protein n=1 Tax=Cordyceps fumosorosea (strain ARSEF 2679) TaxID=1081104 RepID=A0A168BVS0_CORFA|nr:hypothetical protein ISF_02581 [Cordyceps fumosorosea ARSEF 2679]OAA70607.1 hypothetical protein ISF_02581 [Cordyceps fumosorosea ARSEF 2679]